MYHRTIVHFQTNPFSFFFSVQLIIVITKVLIMKRMSDGKTAVKCVYVSMELAHVNFKLVDG